MVIRSLKGGQFKVLTESQMKEIHYAVLSVLNDVGVRVEYKPALELFRDNGCKVDFTKHIVYIPEQVLNKALNTAPATFTLYGQKPEYDVCVDTENVYTIGGSSALNVLDLDGIRRLPTSKDLVDFTRLLDKMENLHIMHAIVIPQDIPQIGFDRILFQLVTKNTYRNYYSQAQWKEGVEDQVKMAEVILGSKDKLRQHPIFTQVLCMISPLTQPAIRVEELMESAKYGIPVYIEVDAQMGSTTPITVAGTLVEECANVLCGVVLTQLINPGNPCIFAIASGLMNMSNGDYCGAAPETNLLHAATAQMAHFYHLPFQGGTGIDALFPDVQAGYERALQVLTCSLAGVNFVHLSLGMMEQMMLASYEQCVIDNEIIGAAFRIVEGIEVNPDTIALDVLKEVGPGGNFLVHEHTVKNFRRLIWQPQITVRDRWTAFQSSGKKDMRQRANERAKKILTEHYPKPLTDQQENEIEKIALSGQKRAIEIEQQKNDTIDAMW